MAAHAAAPLRCDGTGACAGKQCRWDAAYQTTSIGGDRGDGNGHRSESDGDGLRRTSHEFNSLILLAGQPPQHQAAGVYRYVFARTTVPQNRC